MEATRLKYIAIGRHMMMLDKMLKKHLRDTLKPYGLGSTEAMVLMHLLACDGGTQEQMIDAMGFDKGVMTRTMQGLEKAELVQRHKHQQDARAFRFFLTEKGRGLQGVLFSAMDTWRNLITRDLSENQLSELEFLLATMTSAGNQVN